MCPGPSADENKVLSSFISVTAQFAAPPQSILQVFDLQVKAQSLALLHFRWQPFLASQVIAQLCALQVAVQNEPLHTIVAFLNDLDAS